MDTQTLERPDTTVDESTDSDTPKVFHYVKKDKIVESAVMGNHVVALCGEVFPVTRSAKPGSPVCPDCKRIYEMMKRTSSPRGLCVGSVVSAVLVVLAILGTQPFPQLPGVCRARRQFSSIAAFSSAPSTIAKPSMNANSRNAIGVASAP